MRIALAAPPFARTGEEALDHVIRALHEAARRGARIVCTPENYVPGHRCVGYDVPPVDPAFLAMAEAKVAAASEAAGVAVILGIEQVVPEGLLMTALVIDRGRVLGRQVKTQIDPDEEGVYVAGSGRRLFEIDGLRFGVVICHEGWRYPETVRWAARRGAHVVFHPHLSTSAPDGLSPEGWADPRNSFHEKAAMCRAAENGVFFATVNGAIPRAATTSAVIAPDGSLIAFLPHGAEGLLVVDIDPGRAEGLLARRLRDDAYHEIA